METTVKTIYANYLQLCKMRNAAFTVIDFSTLNNKFDVNASVTIPNDTYPVLEYITMGNGGTQMFSNTSIQEPIHSPKYASLYNHVPFIMRPVDNDLTPAEISNYRLRVTNIHNGIEYASYYAKKISAFTSPLIYNLNITKDEITATTYIPDQLNLFPEPILNAPNMLEDHTNYIAITDSIGFSLTTEEIQEMVNAHEILNGPGSELLITEIGLCSALEASFIRSTGNPVVDSSYTDIYATQINYFIAVHYLLNDIASSSGDINKRLQIGISEPILDF